MGHSSLSAEEVAPSHRVPGSAAPALVRAMVQPRGERTCSSFRGAPLRRKLTLHRQKGGWEKKKWAATRLLAVPGDKTNPQSSAVQRSLRLT